MSSAWLSAAIQEFEQVTLDNGTELFRVWAHAQREDDPEPRPVLETRGPDGIADIYEPMSSGGDRRGLLRLAYAVPTDRVGPGTAFSLRLPDGYRIELPAPTPGENRDDPEDGQRWHDVDPASERRDADGELQERLAELTVERDAAVKTIGEQQAEIERLTARVRQLQARIELLRADATGDRADATGDRPGTDPRLRQLESEREQLTTHVRALAKVLSIDERLGDGDGGGAVEPTGAVADGAADPFGTIRARAVRTANEHAERELRRLRAGTLL